MLFSPEVFQTYVLACLVLTIVPGPSVTIIVANSLLHGTRAGVLTVAGTQLGVAVALIVLMFGLTSVVEAMAIWFEWIKLAGAAYLVWLGVKLWRSSGSPGDTTDSTVARHGFFWQGFIVVLSNPKLLFFFCAFIPQFIDSNKDISSQIAFLGITFMIVTTMFDSGYALLAGNVRSILKTRRIRILERISGSCLIGGGIWLALIGENS